jgi:hypothetical protein
MFFIPGWLISALTFPGVILHEWAHKLFCDRMGVTVLSVRYFQFGKKVAGYVQHEAPTTYGQTFWISIGPLLVNSLVAVGLSYLATQTVSGGWFRYLLFWLAISAGMHSFPSDQDMSHVASASKFALKEGGSFAHYLAFPLVWVVWFANKLRIIWFDALWAIILVSIGGGFGTFADMTTTQQDKLSAQIETCKSSLITMGNEANSDQQNLDSMDALMTQYQNNGDTDKYNGLVDTYNSLLAKTKAESASYESNRAACNNLIDQYNNGN